MREIPASARGSGPVHCCGGHRERCLFGRPHSWTGPWYESGQVQRLATTYHCSECGGVCTAEEGDCVRCGGSTGAAPVTLPSDQLHRHWCSSGCRDAELEDDRRREQRRERAAYLAVRIDFREFPVNTHSSGPCYVCQDPVQPHRDLVAWSTEGKDSSTYPAVDLHTGCLPEVKQEREHAERLASVSTLATDTQNVGYYDGHPALGQQGKQTRLQPERIRGRSARPGPIRHLRIPRLARKVVDAAGAIGGRVRACTPSVRQLLAHRAR